jgi:hypothetical protein
LHGSHQGRLAFGIGAVGIETALEELLNLLGPVEFNGFEKIVIGPSTGQRISNKNI